MSLFISSEKSWNAYTNMIQNLVMNTEEIIKENAILILEQKKKIETLTQLLNKIAKELPVEYSELDEEEDLPRLAAHWVYRANTAEERIQNFSKELKDLTYKFRI